MLRVTMNYHERIRSEDNYHDEDNNNGGNNKGNITIPFNKEDSLRRTTRITCLALSQTV